MFVDIINSKALPTGYGAHIPVLHVVNPITLAWPRLLELLESSGLQFNQSPPSQWIGELEALSDLDSATEGLLDMWRSKVTIFVVRRGKYSHCLQCNDHQVNAREPTYDISLTSRISATSAQLLTRQIEYQGLVNKWVTNWKATGFLR